MTHFLLKVAKKLEKLENRENRNVDSDEEDDFDCDQGDYPSIDSFRWDVFRIFLWYSKEAVKCYFTDVVLSDIKQKKHQKWCVKTKTKRILCK